jgi:hypothetical protein
MKTSRPPGVRSGTRQRSESSGFPSVPTASVSSFDRPQWVTKEAPADGRQGTEHGWEAGRKRKRAKCAGVSCMGLGRCGRGWMHQPTHACCRVSQGVGGQEACATVRTASLERIRPSDQTGRNAGSQPASQPTARQELRLHQEKTGLASFPDRLSLHRSNRDNLDGLRVPRPQYRSASGEPEWRNKCLRVLCTV